MASVPAAHPYVQHLGVGAEMLPDPPPPGAAPGQWWPPVMVDPAWVRTHAATFDLMHLHFGLESFSLAHLEATVAALREAGRPLVQTVHDLVHPQLADQARHTAQLDVLIGAADGLITLTPGAAAEIERRWGREATVLAHPHMHPLDAPLPTGSDRAGPRVVGVHLRDLRPNVDGPGATAALLDAVGTLRTRGHDVVARVDLRDRVRDEAARDAVRARCETVDVVQLREGPRRSDADLAADLADLDVTLLPYAHGTHSGWAELCWDLGVPVAVPAAVGPIAEQHVDPSLEAFPAGGLAPVLERLLALEARPGSAARSEIQLARRARRRTDDARTAQAHLAVYRRVLDQTTVRTA